MKKIILASILCGFSISHSFSQKLETKLIGKWKWVANESKKEVVFITFYNDNKGFDSGTEEEFEYLIDGNVLTLENIKYDILKLNKRRMTLKKQPEITDLFDKVWALKKVKD